MPGITTTELSRRIGRSRAAILKLARNGTIPRNLDGTFDEAAVRHAYSRNTHPAWRKPLAGTSAEATKAPPALPPHAADTPDPDTLIRRVLAEEGRPVEGGISHDDARAAEVILRCRKLAQDLAANERDYIAKAPVQRHIETAFAALCAETQALPARYGAQMAAEIRCDRSMLEAALGKVIDDFIAGLSSPMALTSVLKSA